MKISVSPPLCNPAFQIEINLQKNLFFSSQICYTTVMFQQIKFSCVTCYRNFFKKSMLKFIQSHKRPKSQESAADRLGGPLPTAAGREVGKPERLFITVSTKQYECYREQVRHGNSIGSDHLTSGYVSKRTESKAFKSSLSSQHHSLQHLRSASNTSVHQ